MLNANLPHLETKQAAALHIVKTNMLWSAGAGILPFPVFDMVAITGVQLKMIKELADFYEVPFSRDVAKSIVASLLGALGSGTLAGALAASSFKFVPVLGPLLSVTSLAATSTAITYAVGRVFIQHFETGGHLLNLDAVALKEHFRAEFEKMHAEALRKEHAAATKVPAAPPVATVTTVTTAAKG